MTRRRRGDDPHARFADWLLASPDEEPPRDLAVHASVCRECLQDVAALDMLTAIDTSLAGPPPARRLPAASRLRPAGRAAMAVGGLAALAAVGFGGWRLLEANWGGAGLGLESPTQAVLGNTGQPEPTLAGSPSLSAVETARDSVGSSPARRTPAPTDSPPIIQPPPPTVQPTPRPTIRPTAPPRPSPTARPTASPTPIVTPEPPTPTPSPTPEAPTPTPTPEPPPPIPV